MAALRVFLLAVALFAPVWALQATPAHACSCIETMPELVERATIIVIGTPQETTILDASVGTPAQALAGTTVDIEEFLKGTGPDRILMHSVAMTSFDEKPSVVPGLGPTCGYAPDLGVRHLLFITQNDRGEYYTQGCAGNLPLSPDETFGQERVAQVRQLLQEPTAQPSPEATVVGFPETGSPGDSSSGSSGWTVVLAATGLLAATAVVGAIYLRRRLS